MSKKQNSSIKEYSMIESLNIFKDRLSYYLQKEYNDKKDIEIDIDIIKEKLEIQEETLYCILNDLENNDNLIHRDNNSSKNKQTIHLTDKYIKIIRSSEDYFKRKFKREYQCNELFFLETGLCIGLVSFLASLIFNFIIIVIAIFGLIF